MRIAFVVVLFTAAATAQSPLCTQIRALTQTPAVAAAHWGVSVTTLSGAPVCAVNDAQLFRPASNAKLFTATAALALLGPTRTFATRVLTSHDNVILEGSGDPGLATRAYPYAPPPYLTTPDPLAALADKVATHSLHYSGDLIATDAAWPTDLYPPAWALDDTLWGYGAPVSALTLYDNKLQLTVIPASTPGQPASVTLSPATTYITIESDVTTLSRDGHSALRIDRTPGTRVIRVTGSVAAAHPQSEDLAIPEPAEFAALTFRTMLETRGVTFDGQTLTRHQSARYTDSFDEQARQPLPTLAAKSAISAPASCPAADCEVLATHTSPTLLEDITLTLKVSQNLHAELLLRQLARQFADEATTAQGVRVIRQFLLNAGLPADEVVLNDGSGLSTHDLTTPRALTSLLTYAATQPWFAGFRAALPIGGVDGSLTARFTGPATKGRVFAKTGTLGESRALSGYLLNASNQTLVFSILVDTHLPNSSVDRTITDQIVTLLANSR